MENFDLIVVGGGKAGKSLAMNRAKQGWKVALIERQFIGGTCINVACIPTKSLVASARRLDEARNDSVFGVEGTGNVHIDLEKLRAHKNGIVSAMIAAHEKFFSAPGIDFMRGSARLLDAHSVEVVMEDGTTRQLHSCGKQAHGIAKTSSASKKSLPRWQSLAADTSVSSLPR